MALTTLAEIPTGAVAIPVGEYFALVDEADVERVGAHRWRALETNSGKAYAWTVSDGALVYMHRLVAETPTGLETDHKNGNSLDNRRCNLRPATHTQNAVNAGKPRRPNGNAPSSAFKGVTRSWSNVKPWKAQITINGKLNYLGLFASEADAARAYDAAALEAWGEFARPNFPIEVSA